MFDELVGPMPFLGHPELPIRNFQRRACRACSMGELRAEFVSKGVDFVVGYVKSRLDGGLQLYLQSRRASIASDWIRYNLTMPANPFDHEIYPSPAEWRCATGMIYDGTGTYEEATDRFVPISGDAAATVQHAGGSSIPRNRELYYYSSGGLRELYDSDTDECGAS